MDIQAVSVAAHQLPAMELAMQQALEQAGQASPEY